MPLPSYHLSMRVFFLLMISLSSCFAGPDWLREFEDSLKRNLNIEVLRPYEHGSRFFLAHPSLLRRWGIINSSATATYNGWLNTIEINPDTTIKDSGGTRVKSIEELQETEQYTWSIAVATVFHEVGHAEYDLFVEEESTPEDARLWKIIKEEIKPWFRRNHPGINSSIAVSELFGYYRTAIIETFHGDIDSFWMSNGVNHFKRRCFLSRNARETIHSTKREEFSTLQASSHDSKLDIPYSQRIDPGYVYVKGKDASLHNAAEEFKQEWFDALWLHFASFHRVPQTKRDMLEFVRETHPLASFAQECRADLYDEATQDADSEQPEMETVRED